MFENVAELQIDANNKSVFFQDYYLARIPVLFKNGAKDHIVSKVESRIHRAEIQGNINARW